MTRPTWSRCSDRTAPFLIWILMHTSPSARGWRPGCSYATIRRFSTAILRAANDYVTTPGKFLDPMADKLVVTTR